MIRCISMMLNVIINKSEKSMVMCSKCRWLHGCKNVLLRKRLRQLIFIDRTLPFKYVGYSISIYWTFLFQRSDNWCGISVRRDGTCQTEVQWHSESRLNWTSCTSSSMVCHETLRSFVCPLLQAQIYIAERILMVATDGSVMFLLNCDVTNTRVLFAIVWWQLKRERGVVLNVL